MELEIDWDEHLRYIGAGMLLLGLIVGASLIMKSYDLFSLIGGVFITVACGYSFVRVLIILIVVPENNAEVKG